MNHRKLALLLINIPSAILLIALIIISVDQNQKVENKNANTFRYSDTTFYIQGTGSGDKILYEDITAVDLVKDVKTEKPINDTYFNGVARTVAYGDARSYVYPHVKAYIIIYTHKRNYIVNDSSIKKTREIYSALKSKI